MAGQGGEAVRVARAVLAEGPVFADGDFAQIGEDACDFIDELGGRQVAELLVELHRDDADGALGAHVGDLLLERGEARGHAIRRDDGEGVRLEGEGVDPAGEALHHRLVAEVHAVENADGESGHAGMRRKLGEGNGTDEHGNKIKRGKRMSFFVPNFEFFFEK